MKPLGVQRIEKAVLGTLEVYEGVPLTASDVADETGLETTTAARMLSHLWSRYVVQRRPQATFREKPVYAYWLGMPQL